MRLDGYHKTFWEDEVEFDVTKEGKLENINIKRSGGPSMDREALRVVKKMPKWLPAPEKPLQKSVHTIFLTFDTVKNGHST